MPNTHWLVDDSPSAHTFSSDATYNESIKKFGSSCMDYEIPAGAGTNQSDANKTDWDFGTGDFTIDFWIYRDGDQGIYTSSTWGVGGILSTFFYSRGGWALYFGNDNKIYFRHSAPASPLVSTHILPNLTWTHVAIVRYINIVKIYFNGVLEGTKDCTGLTYTNICDVGGTIYINLLMIGKFFGDYYATGFKGYIDGVRIVKGVAKWTGDFVPPNSEYTDLANVVLLMHFNTTPTILKRVQPYAFVT